MVINPLDTLYLESGFTKGAKRLKSLNEPELYSVHRSISLGFNLMADNLFGIPEREDTLRLENTGTVYPYEIFASDVFAHPTNNKQPLYGSVPYIMSLSET